MRSVLAPMPATLEVLASGARKRAREGKSIPYSHPTVGGNESIVNEGCVAKKRPKNSADQNRVN